MLGLWGFILLGLIGLVTLVMVASFGGTGVAYLMRIRQVTGATEVRISDLSATHAGWVRVRGRAGALAGQEPLPAPGSGLPCLAWSGLVEQLKEPDWVPVRHVGSDRPFVVEEAGATVTVEPDGALWHLSGDEIPIPGEGLTPEAVAAIFGDLEPPKRTWRLLARIVPDRTELVMVGPPPGQDGAALRPVVLADGDPLPAVVALRGRALAAVVLSALLVVVVIGYVWMTLRDAGLP